MALLAFSLLSAGKLWAQGQYYWGDGRAWALYEGTTKVTTLDEVETRMWGLIGATPGIYNMREFSRKLSQRQSRLLWDALRQYNYAPGELYTVIFAEAYAPNLTYVLLVQIEADGSASWRGLTCQYRQ